jgi:hypothetical protein
MDYFLMKKYEVFNELKQFKALVENHILNKINVLKIDNGGEVYENNSRNYIRSEK